MLNPLDLSGRRVLVTGASSGIGQATALYLARLGARVVLLARDTGRLDATLSQMEGEGHAAFSADLSDLDAIPSFLKRLAAEAGPLDGLVHSAGALVQRPLKVLSSKNLALMQSVNVDAAIMLVKGLRQPGVRAPAAASVVLISSVSAIRGAPTLAGYAATKGALISLTRTLAVELAPENIRVNCLCAGLVRTRMMDELESGLPGENADKLKAEYPLGIGEPDDVAYAASFLLASPARWITGTTLVIDGGYSA